MRVKEMKCRRLMYMPTFRDKNVNYINEAIPSWEDLNEVLMQNNVCLYLKLHRMQRKVGFESLRIDNLIKD